MNVLSRLAKAQTIVVIVSIAVGIYDTYSRLHMDKKKDEKDEEIAKLQQQVAALKKKAPKKKR